MQQSVSFISLGIVCEILPLNEIIEIIKWNNIYLFFTFDNFIPTLFICQTQCQVVQEERKMPAFILLMIYFLNETLMTPSHKRTAMSIRDIYSVVWEHITST